VSATRPGTTVGRYRLDELLNTGGMGEVWRAYDTTLGRQVAVKLLLAGVNEPADRQRFIREARAAAQLNHPNVVAIFDVGEWSGRPYLVMELLDGRTLAEELHARGPLPIEEVRDLAAQAASALHAAHSAGVVHRDIKPSNLFRTRDGVLKIVDFGIARVLDEASTRLTRTGTVVGTAAYLAPEQARGRTADVRTDLYSLGCVIYQLLCGRAPFTGGVTEVIYAHVHTPPEPPSRLRADVPPDLEALVLALLAKNPNERPRDAAQVRTALLAGSRAPTVVLSPRASVGTQDPGGLGGSHSVAGSGGEVGDPTRPLTVDIRAGEGTGRRRRWLPWVVVAAAVAGLVALATLLPGTVLPGLGAPQTPSAGETARPSSGVGQSASPAPTDTPSPSSTPPPTPLSQATTPVPEIGTYTWLRRLDAALALLATTGADRDVVDKLRDRVDDALQAYDEGREGRARKEVARLLRDLRKARDKGDLDVRGPLVELLDVASGDGDVRGDRDGQDDGDEGPPGRRRGGND